MEDVLGDFGVRVLSVSIVEHEVQRTDCQAGKQRDQSHPDEYLSPPSLRGLSSGELEKTCSRQVRYTAVTLESTHEDKVANMFFL